MVQINRSYIMFCFLGLSCIISEIWRDINRKSQILPVFDDRAANNT